MLSHYVDDPLLPISVGTTLVVLDLLMFHGTQCSVSPAVIRTLRM